MTLIMIMVFINFGSHPLTPTEHHYDENNVENQDYDDYEQHQQNEDDNHDYDDHLRANLAPVIGQLCCPEEVKPKIMLITIFTNMIMMALNDDDHHNNLVVQRKKNLEMFTSVIIMPHFPFPERS